MAMRFTQTHSNKLCRQMQQSVELLQMNSAQLEAYVSQACSENPFLEHTPPCTPLPFRSSGDSIEAYLEVLNQKNRAKTLFNHLQEQIGVLPVSSAMTQALYYLAASLDARGYLRECDADIASALHITAYEAGQAVAQLQKLDPPGVGARDLAECLMIQLRTLQVRDPDAEKLISKLSRLAPDSKGIRPEALSMDAAAFDHAKKVVLSLNPTPANGFASEEDICYIGADLIVEIEENGAVSVSCNDSLEATLRIDTGYASSVRAQDDSQATKAYTQRCLQSASALLCDLRRRKQTLLACGQLIVGKQRDFFYEGPAFLRPLALQELADMLEMHVSTVSRAVQNKTLLCRYGLFPLRFFFPRTAALKEGTPITAANIKRLLGDILTTEDAECPYSDQKLTELLATRQIRISRSAVAKYRAQMGIPSTVARRMRPVNPASS